MVLANVCKANGWSRRERGLTVKSWNAFSILIVGAEAGQRGGEAGVPARLDGRGRPSSMIYG